MKIFFAASAGLCLLGLGDAFVTPDHSSFVSPVVRSSRRAPLPSKIDVVSPSALRMVKPGQSEAQEKEQRAAEIRQKIAQLKSSGRFKDTSAEESMMNEAEQFFSKESPLRKFERKKLKEKAEKELEEGGTPEDNSAE